MKQNNNTYHLWTNKQTTIFKKKKTACEENKQQKERNREGERQRNACYKTQSILIKYEKRKESKIDKY